MDLTRAELADCATFDHEGFDLQRAPNRAIKTTLHDDTASFFYLNNGVTAVCDDVEPKGKVPTSGARKFKVQTAADAYPRKRLLDYLSGRALQL